MIAFSAYMQEWLYGKEGYYRYAVVGKGGDFYTSVSVSKFFGGSIAYHLLGLLESAKLGLPLKIIEIGADRGYLIGDVAEFLIALSDGVIPHCEFISIEPLEEKALVQKANFLKQTGLELQVFKDLHALNLRDSESAFVFCNELFDAFACEVIMDKKMAYVHTDTHCHQLSWGELSQEACALLDIYPMAQGLLPIYLESFISLLLSKLQAAKAWRFLAFDYGQWGVREDINLRAYQNHCVYNFTDIKKDLKRFYQQSDITYDVDFALIADIFESYGAQRIFFAPQMRALVDLGLGELLEKFAASTDYQHYLREVSKIKTLISPTGLGERFYLIGFEGGKKGL
ncbi:hypothetical protein BKH46_00455 [Helicobacter sp. 12S02634-8]|uniref:SAM-dependent methyltransferase n=1 Tax=Helicobacter sp. 12S02634-8 TaxID=1476199 RepID=UPI000BA6D34D|nr:SAM-dependent methyltransferase [Helicobacter sp. 12S02634-8]PAF48419.1 hypothetical protein BKH46_00455 [Helicobacter sp. 12S02634-8]